jgi:hypothetical protein
VPVQFKGNHVVLFWAAESVLLLVLYQRSKINLLKTAALIVPLLMLVSLIINWSAIYFSGEEIIPVIFNKGFITSFVASVALFIYYRLMKKEQEGIFANNLTSSFVRNSALIIGTAILYLSGILELYYQFSTRHPQTAVYVIYLQAYSFAFVIGLLYMLKKNALFPLFKIIFTAFCLALFLINLSTNYQVSASLVAGIGNGKLFLVHWPAALLLLWLLCDLIRFFFKNKDTAWREYKTPLTWIAAIGIILLLSVEIYHVDMWANFKNAKDWQWWENLYYKAGLSILWSISSFSLMWLGMKYRFPALRIISLSLFTLTLVKLFVYDIRNIPPGGKIAAFILLGILLLAVSFMYQRLKKIIIESNAE